MGVAEALNQIREGLADDVDTHSQSRLESAGYITSALIRAATLSELEDRDPPALTRPVARLTTEASNAPGGCLSIIDA